MDLGPLGVHHDGDSEPFLLVEPPHGADDAPVPLAVAVAHVEAGHVHATDSQRLELRGTAGGGPHGADELGAARAPEAVLPQVGLRRDVDVDGRGLGDQEAVGVGEGGEVGVAGAAGSREAVRAAGGEAEVGGGGERREGVGGGGDGLGGREVEEGVGGCHGDAAVAAVAEMEIFVGFLFCGRRLRGGGMGLWEMPLRLGSAALGSGA